MNSLFSTLVKLLPNFVTVFICCLCGTQEGKEEKEEWRNGPHDLYWEDATTLQRKLGKLCQAQLCNWHTFAHRLCKSGS